MDGLGSAPDNLLKLILRLLSFILRDLEGKLPTPVGFEIAMRSHMQDVAHNANKQAGSTDRMIVFQKECSGCRQLKSHAGLHLSYITVLDAGACGNVMPGRNGTYGWVLDPAGDRLLIVTWS